MKFYRFWGLLLSLAMILGIFTGCGDSHVETEVSVSQENSENVLTEQDDVQTEQDDVQTEQDDVLTEQNDIPIPDDEYERGIWYGFLPEELNEADPHDTVVTWKQYCSMLGKMIEKYDAIVLAEWEEKQKLNASAIEKQKRADEERLRKEREERARRKEAERIEAYLYNPEWNV